MREYKFRGRRIDTGEWVYGYLLITQMSGVYIIGTKTKSTPHKIGGEIASVSIRDVVWQYEVDPDTAGQYTSLHDKNGKEIYEGDILKDINGLAVIKWVERNASFEAVFNGDDSLNMLNYLFIWNPEVIGNIHENPELLQK